MNLILAICPKVKGGFGEEPPIARLPNIQIGRYLKTHILTEYDGPN